MAGYFRKLNGYVYDGMNAAGETLHNGEIVEITAANGVKKITAAGDFIGKVVEKTTLFGLPAVVIDIVNEGTLEHFIVENVFDGVEMGAYNMNDYAIPAGKLVRMKRPLIGEQVIITVTAEVLATLALKDLVKPASGGTIAKYTPVAG